MKKIKKFSNLLSDECYHNIKEGLAEDIIQKLGYKSMDEIKKQKSLISKVESLVRELEKKENNISEEEEIEDEEEININVDDDSDKEKPEDTKSDKEIDKEIEDVASDDKKKKSSNKVMSFDDFADSKLNEAKKYILSKLLEKHSVREGNAFTAARAKAIANGDKEFEVDGKTYPLEDVDKEDKENAEEFVSEKFKPHFMYNGDKKVMADTYEKHLELKDKGYGHEEPKAKDVEEGNAFTSARAKAIANGDKEFEVDGKTYPLEDVDKEDEENAKEFVGERSDYLPKKEVEAIKKWVYDNGYDAAVLMLSDLWDSKKGLVKRILDDVPEKDHEEMIDGLKKAGLYESVHFNNYEVGDIVIFPPPFGKNKLKRNYMEVLSVLDKRGAVPDQELTVLLNGKKITTLASAVELVKKK